MRRFHGRDRGYRLVFNVPAARRVITVEEPFPRRVVLNLPAEAQSLARVRHAVSGLARQDAFSPQQIHAVELAVSEAVANVVKHAYDGQPKRGPLVVCAELKRKQLVVEVCDEGAGVKARVSRSRNGLGMPHMAALASHVKIKNASRGTCVRMLFAA
jgi:anti-sigma regulatory factor (Ser/Thr protein kinase)